MSPPELAPVELGSWPIDSLLPTNTIDNSHGGAYIARPRDLTVTRFINSLASPKTRPLSAMPWADRRACGSLEKRGVAP